MKRQCAGKVCYDGWGRLRLCSANATLEHAGKWWCKKHHPPTVAERDDEKWAARVFSEEKRRAEQAVIAEAKAWLASGVYARRGASLAEAVQRLEELERQ